MPYPYPYAASSTWTGIEIIEHGKSFEKIDGQFKCFGTLVFYKSDGHVYHAHSKTRHLDRAKIKTEELMDRINKPIGAYSPLFESSLTAFGPPPTDCHIKRPRLISYDRVHNGACPYQISDQFLAEARMCGILKHQPHPNVAQYLGSQVRNCRITGLCCTEYKQILMKRVQPWTSHEESLQWLWLSAGWLQQVHEGYRERHSAYTFAGSCSQRHKSS